MIPVDAEVTGVKQAGVEAGWSSVMIPADAEVTGAKQCGWSSVMIPVDAVVMVIGKTYWCTGW